jgi:two-component system, cell cycle response regulator DivK
MTTALIIEDNPDNMLLICDILESNNYHTIQAKTGLSGIELAESKLPDFIILDIQLPDIIGNEVLVRIRKNKITKHIPVIAMTSYAMTGDKEKLLATGCDGYVEKPINPTTVMDQILRAIGDRI